MQENLNKTTVKFIDPNSVDADFLMKVEGFVSAGFPSPANDYVETELSLKELFYRNPSSTFFVQVDGNSMIGAGIRDKDYLVVDKSLEPNEDSVLVCFIDGEFTLKKVQKIDGSFYLIPENPQFKPIKINENADFKLWGVVTFCIHKFR